MPMMGDVGSATTADMSRPADPPRVAGPRRLGFIPALDGFRAMAVIIVVVHHLPAVVPSWGSWLWQGGFLGVDVFFVLSGFLITALLLSEVAATNRVGLRHFYARRVLRLFPALVLLLAVHVVYIYAIGVSRAGLWPQTFSILVYFQNWIHLKGTTEGLGHLWSLGVEEQFYFVWPVVALVLLPRAAAGRVRLDHDHRVDRVRRSPARGSCTTPGCRFSSSTRRIDYRADSLLIGCLLAYLWAHGRLPRRGIGVAAWISFAFLLECIWRYKSTSPFFYQGGYTLVGVAVATMLLATIEGKWAMTKVFEIAPAPRNWPGVVRDLPLAPDGLHGRRAVVRTAAVGTPAHVRAGDAGARDLRIVGPRRTADPPYQAAAVPPDGAAGRPVAHAGFRPRPLPFALDVSVA